MNNQLNFTIADLKEMTGHEEFVCKRISLTQHNLINFGANMPETAFLALYILNDGIEALTEAKKAFDKYAEEKGITRGGREAPPQATFDNYNAHSALQFCALIGNLEKVSSLIYNEILPVVSNLKVNSLDLESIESAAENINYFLNDLEVSYKDRRF